MDEKTTPAPSPTRDLWEDAPQEIREKALELDDAGRRQLVEELIKSATLPTGPVCRAATIERSSINVEKRTVELSFSSEEPVERWFGMEVLDHGKGSVRLDRLRQAGPLLVEHDRNQHIGTVEKAWLDDDRKARAVVRFGKSAFAEEVFQDVQDGIKKSVSVGYWIHELILESEKEGEIPVYRSNDWEPTHIAFVSEPADVTVGPGRSRSDADRTIQTKIRGIRQSAEEVVQPPTRELEPEADVTVTQPERTGSMETDTKTPELTEEQRNKIRDEERLGERERARRIRGLGQKFKESFEGAVELAERHIDEGKTVAEFQRALLEELPAGTPVPDTPDTREIGMDRKDAMKFRFVRLAYALANPSNREAQRAAGLELEASRTVADEIGVDPDGAFVPVEVLHAPLVDERDLYSSSTRRAIGRLSRLLSATLGTDTGDQLVATELMNSAFIDFLYNRGVVMPNATILRDLNGNVSISRLTAGAAGGWITPEATAAAERTPTFDQVDLIPKTVGAWVKITRRLMLQSSIDIEALVRRDLALQLTLAIDRACIDGTGASGEPRGILNTSGIGSVASSATLWDDMVDLETEVAQDNADVGDLAYATNAKVVGLMKKSIKGGTGSGRFVMEGPDVNGYAVRRSNQFPSDLGAGSDNLVIFGNWADLMVGLWGALDINVDPFTESTAGNTRITALQEADCAVRHPESFAAMSDLTIT